MLEKLAELTESVGHYSKPIPWNSCATINPIAKGTYLCFEPDIGPGPDFVFLRWDDDRGWRDDNDNKGFPTHWVQLNIPNRA